MREFKFRGLGENGEWAHGLLNVISDEMPCLLVKAGAYISNAIGMPWAYPVRPETVGQFTGLKDCNGKEIYEGDILEYDFRKKRVSGPVAWIDILGLFDVNDKWTEWSHPLREVTYHRNAVVIGNIYDNPELLPRGAER